MPVTVVHSAQSGLINGGGGGTFGFSPGFATTTGNTYLIGVVLWSQGGVSLPSVPTVNDGGTNTFTRLAAADATSVAAATFGLRSAFFYSESITGQATPTINAVLGESDWLTITVWELNAGAAHDGGVGANGLTSAGNQNANAGSIVPSASGAFGAYQALESDVAGDNWTLTGWTSVGHSSAGSGSNVAAHQTGLSASTAFTMPYAANGATWAASGITFVPPGGVASLSVATIN